MVPTLKSNFKDGTNLEMDTSFEAGTGLKLLKKILINPITPGDFAAFGDPLTVKYIGMFYAENS